MRLIGSLGLVVLVSSLVSCRTLEVRPTSFKPPTRYSAHFESHGFAIAFIPILGEESSEEHFNVDFGATPVLPVRIVVQNLGNRELIVEATQIFGVSADGDFYQSYALDQSTRIVRRSEIGQGMATGAAVGLLTGAAIGAGIGAGVGCAVDGSNGAGQGAAAGAIVGGASGTVGGAAAGADETERNIRREMRRADWGSQVVYPGEIKTGYVFLPREDYGEIAFNLYDLIERKPISGVLPFAANCPVDANR